MKKYKKLLVFLILYFPYAAVAAAASIHYELSFVAPQTHYTEVKIEINGWNSNVLDLKLPVWAPGSYLIREFSRHVDSFTVTDGSLPLAYEKINKNTWRINCKGKKNILITYKVYAFELSVRTSFVDKEHAFLNGSSVFMYNDQLMKQPVTVKIIPFREWKNISVPLENATSADQWNFKAEDYDALVDAPFEIGNHKSIFFTAAGVPHEVAMFGEGNYNPERIKADFTKIIEEATAVFGEHPCKRYVFFVHNLASGGGGLEHKNACALQAGRWAYDTESAYSGFLSLVAHEYFHLWNVKRLRPVPLGPFDYSNENYTTLLWFSEGFTSYYDDLLVRRCGFSSESEYLRTIAGSMSYCQNIKGGAFQSLSESSFDAWIKYYRPSENAANATVSYYTKGGVVAALLDMEIMIATGGDKSLDDVMKEMYSLYYKKLNKAFSEQELITVVNKVAGKDMRDFFVKYVDGVQPLPISTLVMQLGMELIDMNSAVDAAYTGATTSLTNNKLMVTAIERNSPAWQSGLNVNDELIAMNNYRTGDDFSKLLSMKKPGEKVMFTVSRGGILQEIEMTLGKSSAVKYDLEKMSSRTSLQLKLYNKWLKL